MFARILSIALVAGSVAGLAATGAQMLWSVPLIEAAEAYESEAAPHAHAHHAGDVWEPADGTERIFWTALANMLLGAGGGLLLAASFALLGRIDMKVGLLWAGGAFLAFSVAPALGLPPQLPGTAAADLYDRQIWWIGTAAATAAGLLVLAYGRPLVVRVLLGPALIVLPHAIGAPQAVAPASIVPDALQREFILASLVISAFFWLLLGSLAAQLTIRFGQRRHGGLSAAP